MDKRVTPSDVHAWLQADFKRLPEIGFGNAILSLILDAKNPFDSRARRRPKLWFVVTTVLGWLIFLALFYFNAMSRGR